MANISHPNEPQYVLELIKTYTKAQQQLINVISQKYPRSSSGAYQKRIIAQTNNILEGLLKESKKWADTNIPREYIKGVEKVIRDYKAMGIDIPAMNEFSRLHDAQIEILVRNATDNLVNSTNFVGRRINDTVRKIAIDSVTQAQLTGGTVQSIRTDLMQQFVDNNITSMKTRNGRNINLDSYAQTVARSTTREAQNQAQINHMRASNKDLVKMSSHATTCPICGPLQGRVYSISGESTEYPPLDFAYTGGYANIHPNCRHTISPYVPALDDDRAKTKAFSNRSFDTDPRSQAQIDNYNKEQKENRLRNADKRQWERYKILMPKETPKTLSGFRRSKQANSAKYQELQSKYRSIRATHGVK